MPSWRACGGEPSGWSSFPVAWMLIEAGVAATAGVIAGGSRRTRSPQRWSR